MHKNLKSISVELIANQESLVIDVKEKLGQEDEGLWQTSVTPEEREQISAKCRIITDWIDEEVSPATRPKVF